MSIKQLQQLAKLIRYYILKMTTAAGSGHPTSSLSATDLMTVLVFGEFFSAKGGSASGGKAPFFRSDLDHPENPNNDRIIFSKGHASPLMYALYAAAGKVSEAELMQYRKFDSPLEGHPTRRFPYAEVATGSLGQGLSVGVGMALNAKYLDKLPYCTFVLLGDSEMAEGSNWEAIQLAAHYKLDNLVGIIDVNRLGQSGETMYGHKVEEFEKRIKAFGWETITVDGHNFEEIIRAFKWATTYNGRQKFQISNFKFLKKSKAQSSKPRMIIAKTIKGKGVRIFENKEGWHGKALSPEELERALKELGPVDTKARGTVALPLPREPKKVARAPMAEIDTTYSQPLATRKAYGHALVEAYPAYPDMVVLDAEVSNSTYAEMFKQKYPKRFFEMFIAEQNMVGAAMGLARRGKIPFVSTFASFFTRAVDQIRVAQYSGLNINFVGSHVGVSVGEDGPTQMGLEDMAIFRAILGSTVLYAADHVAEEDLVKRMIEHPGICYMRTTRLDTPPLYKPGEQFPIGGSKVLRQSGKDVVTVVAAGVTLYEALKAYEELKKAGLLIRVIDLYSIKPIDVKTLQKAAKVTKAIITVEDHFAEGGMGEAVASAMGVGTGRDLSLQGRDLSVHILAVRKMPRSGKPAELLAYEEIDAGAIMRAVRKIVETH